MDKEVQGDMDMGRIVKKFGGSSVGSTKKILQVANIGGETAGGSNCHGRFRHGGYH